MDEQQQRGEVTPLDFHDAVTGQHLVIRVSDIYTVISVDGRDYYFDRGSGKFDGTGSSVPVGDQGVTAETPG